MHKFLFYNKLIIFLYMFRALLRSSSGGQNCTVCPTRYRTRHFFNNFTTNEDEIWSGLISLCKKCDDVITCAGSGHHLRPERIEPGMPYFGKSLPLRPLSLPEFLRRCLLSRRLWFVVCFGKLSLSDIPIRNNQAASDRASAVAKVPSKWRSRR